MTSVWPNPRPEDDRCYCYHPHDAHNASTGFCDWESYGDTCDCRRYRNLAEIRRGRREERFWEGVGGHDLYC